MRNTTYQNYIYIYKDLLCCIRCRVRKWECIVPMLDTVARPAARHCWETIRIRPRSGRTLTLDGSLLDSDSGHFAADLRPPMPRPMTVANGSDSDRDSIASASPMVQGLPIVWMVCRRRARASVGRRCVGKGMQRIISLYI